MFTGLFTDLRVLYRDVSENIRNVFASVGRFLKSLIDILHLDDSYGIRGLEKLLKRDGKDIVGKIFETVYLDTAFVDGFRLINRPCCGNCLFNLLGLLDDDLCGFEHPWKGSNFVRS